MTTSVLGTANVAGVSPDGFVDAKTAPEPSSTIVTVAGVMALMLPVLVAVKLNGSLLSEAVSCSGASNTRTNALPAPLSGIKSPA